MRLRTLLFVPGDRPDRMEKALQSQADALILDLEDSVALSAKERARRHVAQFLGRAKRRMRLFVRVNPLGGDQINEDLAAILPTNPDGIVLPKAEGAISLAALDRLLGNSAAKILPIATETPKAIFALGTYGDITSRLCGLTWGAEDLSAAIGAATARESDGLYTAPYELARSLTLFGAHAAGVPAIETIYPAYRDLDGLAAYARRGQRDGFTGMMAIHPTQIPIINAAFRPSEREIIQARRVIALFEGYAGVGVLELDGKMVDAPHLAWARKVLEAASE